MVTLYETQFVIINWIEVEWHSRGLSHDISLIDGSAPKGIIVAHPSHGKSVVSRDNVEQCSKQLEIPPGLPLSGCCGLRLLCWALQLAVRFSLSTTKKNF
uniref:Uncharacterized protein n=1 Tax=Anguilla anguilla TaxID=7936 RepID=A0A0E9WI25_ANGAN